MENKFKSVSEVEGIRNTLNASRDAYINSWRTQAKFISPERFVGSNPSQRNRGQQKGRDILRNKAGRALRTFVSGMMNGATSRARPWFDLTLVNKTKMNTNASRFFSQSTKIINEHLQISNFYRVLPMSYKDIGIFSNSAYAMLPHDRYGFYFMPFAVGTYSIGTDSEGMVNTFSRDFTLSVRQVVETYGKLKSDGHIDWSNFPAWIQQAYENSNYNQEVTLGNLILPNPNPVPESLLSANAMKYQSYTFIRGIGSGVGGLYGTGFRYSNQSSDFKKTVDDGSPMVSVKGYEYFPVICNRWEVAPESDWGVDGPGQMAIDDIKSLQEMEKYRQEGVAKLVRPPMVAPASLRRHQSSILAGGITYVDEASEGTKYRAAFEVNPNLSELINSQAEYEKAISAAFFEDLFLMMSEDRKISHVTAREIEERSAEKLMGVGPALGQLDQDQNGRVIANAFYLLNKMGRIPSAPKEIQGEDIRPEYISILAQAAKASMVGSTDKLVQFIGGLSQVTQDPSLAKIIKADAVVRQYADYIAIDPELIRDEEEYGEIVQAMSEKANKETQLQQANIASQTSKNLSSAEVQDNNMLGLMKQMQEKL